MSERLLRGRVLSFRRAPEGAGDLGALDYYEDGALVLREGLIAAVGPYAPRPGAEVIDHRPHLLLPGLIDTHLHLPQMQVIASHGAALLDWLARYTFPEEARFADPAHAARMARHLIETLLRHGTTTPVVYGSSHAVSVEALFSEAERCGLRLIAGKTMMDRNAPPGVLDTAQSAYDETKALIEHWHGRGRTEVAITPRFAITSTPAQMEAAQALVRAHPGCPVQTHLSENHAEIALTAELYPEA
ncbi:MAG: amidohydrolase family protein, partial [Pseudomonadota bacterium]